MLTSKEPIRLWIDTDTSGLFWSGLDCDDDLAVLAALSLHKRQILHLDGISICGGNAPLSHTWQDIHALWEHADGFQITNVQPVKGYGWRSMQVAVGWLRWYNKIRQDGMDSEDASTAIIERSRDKSLDPAHILMLGPPTNLAKAIDSGLLDQAGVSHVYLMGGELTQQTLDLNFRTDRASARTIIESNIPTTIIPIQTCAQTIVTKSYLERLDCPSMAACAILPKMNQQIKLMPRFVNQAVKKRCSLGEDYGPWIVLLSSPSKTTTMPPNEETLLTAARRPSVVMIQQEEQIQVPAGFNLLRKMMEWAPLWCFLLIDNVTYAYTAAFGVAAFDMLFLSFVQYKMGKLQEWPKPLDAIFLSVFGLLTILAWIYQENVETIELYSGTALNTGLALGFFISWLLGRPVVSGYQADEVGVEKASHPVMVHMASRMSVMFTIAFSAAAVISAIWPESDWAILICNIAVGGALLTAYKFYPSYVKNHTEEIAALYEDEIVEWEAKHPELNFDGELA